MKVLITTSDKTLTNLNDANSSFSFMNPNVELITHLVIKDTNSLIS